MFPKLDMDRPLEKCGVIYLSSPVFQKSLLTFNTANKTSVSSSVAQNVERKTQHLSSHQRQTLVPLRIQMVSLCDNCPFPAPLFLVCVATLQPYSLIFGLSFPLRLNFESNPGPSVRCLPDLKSNTTKQYDDKFDDWQRPTSANLLRGDRPE